MRDRKAFEEDAFGRMWQADTCYFPYITEDGQFPIRQTNKNDNCHTKRSNGSMIDYTKMGGAHV